KWNDGKESLIKNFSSNQLLTVDYNSGRDPMNRPVKNELKYFAEKHDIEFKHQETNYNDFKTQPLLLHGFSNQGPSIAVGDVNGDGADDFFVGGAYGSSGTIFLQSKNGFEKETIHSEDYEDLGAIFFDADGDNDLDLYVVSGGAERYANHKYYQDRIYT